MYFKNDGTNITFIGNYLEMYVPETYFPNFATLEGSTLKTLGVIPCAVFDSNMKEINSFILNIPSMITVHALNMYNGKRQLVPRKGDEPEQCRIFKFYKNEPVMLSSVQKDGSIVEMFLRMIVSGKLTYVPYNKLLAIWDKNLEMNDITFNVSSCVLEIILSEIYRNKDNPDEKFSKVLMRNPKTSQYDYAATNIKQICAKNSTFAALSFEDMDSMITASLNMNKYGKKQIESPIEKIMKM